MSLSQFAVAVGASPRWVLNAHAVLGLKRHYTDRAARQLGLAREIRDATGIPLRRAWRLAAEALAAWPAQRDWVHSGRGASVQLVVDLERYLSDHAIRLSLSRTRYGERRRGRPRRGSGDPVAAAEAYGIDVSLLRENLQRSPEARLRRLEEAKEFLRAARPVR